VALVSTDGQEPQTDVHEAAPGERPAVCATLTAVVAADPVAVWLVPAEMPRFALATLYSRRLYDRVVEGGGRVDTARNADGVALWYPLGGGGCHSVIVDRMRRDFGAEGVGAHLAEARDRFDALDAALLALTPNSGHRQLAAHAVRPLVQDLGIGRRVLEHGHRQLDPGTAVFVVVSTEQAARFYAQLGYDSRESITLPGGPTLRALRREPRGSV
jgi:ribosomal protein S18 acetylase RimI-like enzyme